MRSHFEQKFLGIVKTRSFTDITCSGVYTVFLAAWIAVACTAFASGDIKRLTLPKGQ